MSHRLRSMTHIFLLVLLMSSGSGNEVLGDSSMLEVLQEEVLDTITLDRAIHFTTPQATDVIAQAGIYRIKVAEPSTMKFMGVKQNITTVVDALKISHQTDITEPVALYVKDDEQFPHVVLLLPGGTGFEAVGSYDAIRARGLRLELTANQIQRALEEKTKKRH